VLDARRCISYLTIEKRTPLTIQERGWIGEWVFGCDVCQDVCPFNFVSLKRLKRSDAHELNAESGAGPALDLSEILKIRTHDDFVARFSGTAIMRAKREGLLRNAAVVAANTEAINLFDDLCEAFQHDPAPLVRQHALWALSVLADLDGEQLRRRVKGLLTTALADPADSVQQEALGLAGTQRV
jgi:epoxyqueuosine reductase